MTLSFPFVLDVVLALLLVVMIWYSVVLNRRLNKFRGNRQQMENLAATFNDATVRATDSIGDLKIASDALQDQLAKAESLRDDLVFLVDRGTIAADRLEDNVRVARDAEAQPEMVDPLEKVAPIRARKAPQAGMPGTANGHPANGRPANGQPINPGPGKSRHDGATIRPGQDLDTPPPPRSEAERALLRAIRSAT